ncbi:MAG: AEC family transporter [Acutalibacteraceae bacterium]
MIQNFFTVAHQVLILFILIGVGFLCGKIKMLNENSVKAINDLVLYIVCPCVIINSFIRKFDKTMLEGLLVTAAAALFVMMLSILIAHFVFHDKKDTRNRVYKFATVFSNCGFISLPLQQALLGNEGVFYGAAYIAVFNIVMWTAGVYISSGDIKMLSPKKVFLNPCIIAVVVGIIIFVFSIPIPDIISEPIGYLSALNTPVPMIIIGFYLSQSKILDAFRNVKNFICVGLRLVIVPLISLGVFLLCGINGKVLIAALIATAASSAASTTMFAAKFGNDTSISVNLVTMSTLLSVITMPLIVGFAQSIS